MKKIYYIIFVAMIFLLIGCEKELFEYSIYKPSVNEVDSIYFSTGTTSLIADGKAKLSFIVETYRKISIKKADGSSKDTLVFFDYTELPEGSLKILDGNGTSVGMTYSTTNPNPGNISFYAQIGQKKSKTKTVTLRVAPTPFAKVTVDVIFHIFEQNPNDKWYDPLTYQPVTPSILVETIKDLNAVMNNTLGNNANGASANIEFRLATHNNSGTMLVNPGMNVITYDNTIKVNQSSTVYSVQDFQAYVNKNPATIWNPKKYLNVYIIPSGANNFMYAYRAGYQVVPAGSSPLPGIVPGIATAYIGAVAPAVNPPLPSATTYPNGVVASESVVPVYWETAGCIVPRTVLFPGMNKRLSICLHVGMFYGVYPTVSASPTFNDFCTDTNKFDFNNPNHSVVNSLKRVGHNGEKFLADNAMDDIRYPSLRNTFTLDQVKRIRWVIANTPHRNNGIPAQ
ncbi:hypothetical protein MASR2M69_10220 [Bacteroidota bacterium]